MELDSTDPMKYAQNDTLTAVSTESGHTPHHIIKIALNRLKRTMGYGIPDKEI